jgi:hypothetical protein
MELTLIRLVSVAMFLTISAYTLATVSIDGWDLLTPFFTDLLSLKWPGQFNLDFSFYLLLSTLWYVWRNEYSRLSLITAPVVLVGGMLVFAAYLFWLTFRVNGQIDVLVSGPNRTNQ